MCSFFDAIDASSSIVGKLLFGWFYYPGCSAPDYATYCAVVGTPYLFIWLCYLLLLIAIFRKYKRFLWAVFDLVMTFPFWTIMHVVSSQITAQKRIVLGRMTERDIELRAMADGGNTDSVNISMFNPLSRAKGGVSGFMQYVNDLTSVAKKR